MVAVVDGVVVAGDVVVEVGRRRLHVPRARAAPAPPAPDGNEKDVTSIHIP